MHNPLRAKEGHAGPGPIGQGTRASLAQGTGVPKDAPTQTQAGGDQQTPNTNTVINRANEWPNNPAIAVTPHAEQADRRFLVPINAIQIGPAPARIMRQLWTRVLGYTGGSSGDSPSNGFPYNAEFGYMPHQLIPRNPMGTSPHAKQIDENAAIQAVYAGNARLS